MADKEKQIEILPNHKEISDLANLLYSKQNEFNISNPYEVGYVIINILGYRKIPEDSVVLTSEQIAEIVSNHNQINKDMVEQARKKTAREIFDALGFITYRKSGKAYIFDVKELRELAKQFGVDLGE